MVEQSTLTAWEKSAEGIVSVDVTTAGTGNELRKAERTHPTEGPNGFKGIKWQESKPKNVLFKRIYHSTSEY